MEKSVVKEIVEQNIKSGTNKLGKPWAQTVVELENGTQARIFEPIKVGDEVESYTTEKDGQSYTNWRIVKHDPKHDDLMLAMREIYKLVAGIYKEVTGKVPEKPNTGLEQARKANAEIKARVEEKKPEPEVVEEVFEVDDAEEINLDDIPF